MNTFVLLCVLSTLLAPSLAASIPEKFLGSWDVDKSENLDEYLSEKGYGWFTRQLVKMSTITKKFEKNADGSYNCFISTPKKNVEWHNFKLDSEFTGEYLDDTQHKVTFSYKAGEDKLIEKHIPVEKPSEVDVYEYTIKDGFLVMRMEYNKVVTYRYYKKN